MKCAIVEYNRVHAEILPTVVYLLNTIGIEADVFVSSRIDQNDPFVFTPDLRFRRGNSHAARFKFQTEASGFAGYDFVIFNSIEPKHVLKKAQRSKIPIIAIMHNAGLLLADPDYRHFFRSGQNVPLVLSRFVSEHLSPELAAPWIAPVFIANVPAADFPRDEPVCFCVQGNLAYDRRNYRSLIDAVDQVASVTARDFSIFLIGRDRPDGRAFRTEVTRRGLRKYFRYSTEGWTRWLEYIGRDLPYRRFYNLLQQAHFILPLVDSSSERYNDYYQTKITSSLSIAFGMGIIPVLEKSLACHYGTEQASISYETGDLAEAMNKALLLSPEEYAALQQRLVRMHDDLLRESRFNLEQAIAKITSHSA